VARLTTQRERTMLSINTLPVCPSLVPTLVYAQGIRVAKVVQVIDGNSLIAEARGGTKLQIRFVGIEAPQLAQGKKPGRPLTKEARDYLDRQIGGKAVRVQAYGQDPSGRTLGVIWYGRST
jgi:endonuclease YncB( thermonuclease family)